MPPWVEPSVSSSPTSVTTRPTRNGRTATSSLRVTISTPTGTSTTGARYAAQPIALCDQSGIGPPLSPNQSTQARKTPIAASARPISSGW